MAPLFQAMIASQQALPPKTLQRLPRWIQHLQLDNRALALFRIGLGLVGLIVNALLWACLLPVRPK